MTRIDDLSRLGPSSRAEVINSLAKAQAMDRLWQLAIGTSDQQGGAPLMRPVMPTLYINAPEEIQEAPAISPPETVQSEGYGGLYAPALSAASARTGVPAPAISAIIDAEAARTPTGEWNPLSRNPRSSAAGLGQFLASTWVSEAERHGTWLNVEAVRNGWLEKGKVRAGSRSELLAMRYEPRASIEATADFAAMTLAGLRAADLSTGGNVTEIARQAYVGHHLGLGDAIRFLKTGLSEARSRQLLAAQIGTSASNARIEAQGSAAVAHRAWFEDFVSRRIRTT
jgi:hypothetical protein